MIYIIHFCEQILIWTSLAKQFAGTFCEADDK
jgi:hypothetical protein